jgi:tetratricopeptide (TPR) repeat protein
MNPAEVTTHHAGAASAAERVELEDERAFLLASLRDLDVERDAGDISVEDYSLLRDRYTVRAAEVLRALAAEERPSSQASPTGEWGDEAIAVTGSAGELRPGTHRRRRRRVVVAVGALVAFGAAAVVAVLSATGSRLPGATATGSPSLGQAQQIQRRLDQAATLEGSGQLSQALDLYHQVLAEDPTQAQALAESGWLEFQAGVQAKDASVVSKAQQTEEAAVRADPGAYAAHLYLGSMLLAEGDAQGAVTEYRSFLADHPPASSVAAAASFITKAFTQAGLPVPALPAG